MGMTRKRVDFRSYLEGSGWDMLAYVVCNNLMERVELCIQIFY